MAVSLSRSIYDLWMRRSLVDQAERRFAKARLDNDELKTDYSRLQDPAYIEEQARNKLGLSRNQEIVVVIPNSPEEQDEAEENQPQTEPTWRQWIAVLWE